ncbi:MAG TPA: phage holin family protein [Streptosporangiaceae bacterium]|nr:phage holin family protein [Streptosporangiaceae bacterium]
MSAVQPSIDEEAVGAPRPVAAELGTGELVKQASQQMSDLVRAEMRLGMAEMKHKAKQTGVGAGMLSAAGLTALYGVGAGVAAAIAAIANVLPVWAAALIIMGALFVIAAVLGLIGRSRVNRGVPPVPEQALESTKQDVIEIKERARR